MDANNRKPVELSIRGGQQSEIASLVQELVRARRQALEFYRVEHRLEPAEANTKVEEQLAVSAEAGDSTVKLGPPQQATWLELERLAEHDPYQVIGRWREIHQAALDELTSGHRAGMVIAAPDGETPWNRAQFLTLRAGLIAEWQPRGAIELTLIDTLAQAQTLYWHWLEVLMQETSVSTEHRRSKYNSSGRRQPPRVSDAEAVELAAAMADRFNRLFLRTLRQLRDLRRYAPPVTIQNAGQVNIGAQQVNMTSEDV